MTQFPYDSTPPNSENSTQQFLESTAQTSSGISAQPSAGNAGQSLLENAGQKFPPLHKKQAVVLNDYSAFGSNSLAAALPVLAAMQIKTHALPSAILTAQTGFDGYEMATLSLSGGLSAVKRYLSAENTGVMSGFLATPAQSKQLAVFLKEYAPALYLLDPVLGDNGVPYPCFSEAEVTATRDLLPLSSVVTPNLTEACLLTGTPYAHILRKCESFGAKAALPVAGKLQRLGAKTVVVTGISCDDGVETLLLTQDENTEIVRTPRLSSRSGTGDLFAALLFGYLLSGKSEGEALRLSAAAVHLALENTENPDPRFGTDFERILPLLVAREN